MKYFITFILSLPLFISAAAQSATPASLASNWGFWCGTEDRELEVKMLNQNNQLGVALNNPDAVSPQGLIAFFPQTLWTIRGNLLVLRALTSEMTVSSQSAITSQYVGSVPLNQVRNVDISINSASGSATTAGQTPVFDGQIRIEQLNGSAIETTLSCVTYDGTS